MSLFHRKLKLSPLEAWQAEADGLAELLADARSNQGNRDGVALVLKADERAFQVLDGSALIEPKRLPGEWHGRSKGFSVPVGNTRMRYRVGASKGHYEQGAEVPAPIDTGVVTITDERVVFQGPKASREWAYAKLLGVQHVDAKVPWTAVQVSNRQKTSGFNYPAEMARGVRFRRDLALAHYHGELDGFVAGLQEEIAEHQAQRGASQ